MSIYYRVFIILSASWRRRYAIAIPILVLPFIGLAIGLMSPSYYSSHTSMLIQETAKMNPFLKDLAVSAMLKERMSALHTLLHSRHILASVAMKRGLLDEHSSSADHDRVISEMSSALTVRMLGKDLIRIDYTSSQLEGIKATLEEISKQFVEQLLAPERSSMRASTQFLAEHLKQRQQELHFAETALAEFKNRHAIDLPSFHLGNMTHLSSLKQRLVERTTELAGATRRLGSLDQQLSKTNPVLGRLEEKIVHIEGDLVLLRARYTDQHSKIRGALRNLHSLQAERLNILGQTQPSTTVSQLWAIASKDSRADGGQTLLVSQLENLQLARSEVDGLKEELVSLQDMIAKGESQAANYGANESELSLLERSVKIKRELYEDFLLRHEKARITQSLSIFEQDKRIKVIDRPFTPASDNKLPLPLFFIFGLIGGILVGSGLALLLELSDTSLRRRDRLEAITGVPVLSRIPPYPRQAQS